jgi:dTDP-4-dehydrorhamnose reductase
VPSNGWEVLDDLKMRPSSARKSDSLSMTVCRRPVVAEAEPLRIVSTMAKTNTAQAEKQSGLKYQAEAKQLENVGSLMHRTSVAPVHDARLLRN